jgi:hypothetical protein
MQVQQDRHPDHLERQRCEDEVVRQGVDLDHSVVPAALSPGGGKHRPDQEEAVLHQVDGQARALMAADR